MPPLPPSAVLFDMDGVLVDSFDAWFHLINATCTHFGHPTITRDTFLSGWGQGVEEDISKYFPTATPDAARAFFGEHFGAYAEHVHVDPDAAKVMNTLREAAIPTAVCTNTPTGLAHTSLGPGGVKPDTVVGSTDVAHSKPAPDMLLLACERLAITPHTALMVGDSQFDRQAAAAAGIPFLAYGPNLTENTKVSSLPEVLTYIGLQPWSL